MGDDRVIVSFLGSFTHWRCGSASALHVKKGRAAKHAALICMGSLAWSGLVLPIFGRRFGLGRELAAGWFAWWPGFCGWEVILGGSPQLDAFRDLRFVLSVLTVWIRHVVNLTRIGGLPYAGRDCFGCFACGGNLPPGGLPGGQGFGPPWRTSMPSNGRALRATASGTTFASRLASFRLLDGIFWYPSTINYRCSIGP